MRKMIRIAVTAAVGTSVLAACSQAPHAAPKVAASSSANSSRATIHPPFLSEDKPRAFPGLHNVVTYHDGFYSGGAPEGDAGFESLAGFGVKTIISVDGSAPSVDDAARHGIRYIHLPIGYNGFDESRGRDLARAVQDAMKDGPVYVHCHHGKHRSAGAAATVAVELGWMTPDQAVGRMKVSGTSPAYTGLYQCTQNSRPLTVSELDAVPAAFPSISPPMGTVRSMVEIDEVTEHLKAIEKAGWNVPRDHPDLVPAAEAGRLADLLRDVAATPRAQHATPQFRDFLAASRQHAERLEEALVAQTRDLVTVSAEFKQVTASCVTCHAAYRDVRVEAAP